MVSNLAVYMRWRFDQIFFIKRRFSFHVAIGFVRRDAINIFASNRLHSMFLKEPIKKY